MVMSPDAEIVHPLPEELAGRGIAVEIFDQEQKLAAEGLKMIQLDSGPRGHISVPVVLLMVLEVNCKNWPQCQHFDSPRASELDAVLYRPRFDCRGFLMKNATASPVDAQPVWKLVRKPEICSFVAEIDAFQ